MTRPRSDFYFFWGHPFSQWGLYPMEIEGITYNCCEQYMMAEKARLFQDAVAEAAIMDAEDPATQKAWGRCVRGFDKAAWESVAREIVYRGNYAKFSQNEAVYLLLNADRYKDHCRGGGGRYDLGDRNGRFASRCL